LPYVKIQKSRKREWFLCWSVVFSRTWNLMSPMHAKTRGGIFVYGLPGDYGLQMLWCLTGFW
jgi:hypothetical protein